MLLGAMKKMPLKDDLSLMRWHQRDRGRGPCGDRVHDHANAKKTLMIHV